MHNLVIWWTFVPFIFTLATIYIVDNNQTPENALFWLRNLTRGKEEQIFYIKEGKQVFVSNIADIYF